MTKTEPKKKVASLPTSPEKKKSVIKEMPEQPKFQVIMTKKFEYDIPKNVSMMTRLIRSRQKNRQRMQMQQSPPFEEKRRQLISIVYPLTEYALGIEEASKQLRGDKNFGPRRGVSSSR